MKVVIVEDEKLAADHLEMQIKKVSPEAIIEARLGSVKESLVYFLQHPSPDLIFMDIQLSDGLSFEVLEAIQITTPVIFTTAYDEYALKAFQANSIAYLLKPIDKDGLEGAFEKMKTLGISKPNYQGLSDQMQGYKQRFLIKVGEHIKTIPVSTVSLFYVNDKVTYLQTCEGRSIPLDYTIEQLSQKLDPADFFRINRGAIVRLDAISDIISYTNSRLKVEPNTKSPVDMIVARERVAEFKNWLDR